MLRIEDRLKLVNASAAFYRTSQQVLIYEVSEISSASFSQVDRLKAELMYERRTSEEHLSRFEDERRVWQEEKEKVIFFLISC